MIMHMLKMMVEDQLVFDPVDKRFRVLIYAIGERNLPPAVLTAGTDWPFTRELSRTLRNQLTDANRSMLHLEKDSSMRLIEIVFIHIQRLNHRRDRVRDNGVVNGARLFSMLRKANRLIRGNHIAIDSLKPPTAGDGFRRIVSIAHGNERQSFGRDDHSHQKENPTIFDSKFAHNVHVHTHGEEPSA